MIAKCAVIVIIILLLGSCAGFITIQNPSDTLKPGEHYPLYREIIDIRQRLVINITEPGFTNPVTVCDWFELREEDSGDYFQTTVNFWVFQNGQELHGDIEAFVEIYNVPNETDRFVIEIARNCWTELTVTYQDPHNSEPTIVCVFPTITENTLALGYMTYEVTY